MYVVRAGSMLGALLFTAGCAAASGAGDDPGVTVADAAITTVGDVAVSVAPTTSVAPASTPPPTTPVDALPDPACVVTVAAGDSLSAIARASDGVSLAAIEEENGLGDGHVIHPGDQLDVCVGNDVDDVTGASRLAPPPAAVRRQQQRLNELFAPHRMIPLVVDGDSGPLTRQMLCAARMGLGLPVSAAHMPAGSAEEETLFAAGTLAVPEGAAVWAERWILIDKTCQVMFTGEGERLVEVYPTSTGEAGYETHDVGAVAAFRFDPALDNDGWHDSTNFPVAIDDPQNGNMYKPIYFNGGQAIHGANYVPPTPRSKGCARMFPLHQDELITWLGLTDVTEPTWRQRQIGVTVTVQGDYRPVD